MNQDHVQAAHLVQKLDWTLKDAKHDFSAVEVAVLAPFTDLRTVQTLVEGDHLELRYGAQDVSTHDAGAYTGEISGQMLAKLGCTYVVVGHSERREYHGEDDAEVRAKVHAALRNGLAPLLCVGEGLPTRQAGEQVEFTVSQVSGALEGVDAEQAKDLVVAYEPVWAIGTGEVATPEDARPVRRIGQVRQHRLDHGPARCRRRARGRSQPRRRRVRSDLPLSGACDRSVRCPSWRPRVVPLAEAPGNTRNPLHQERTGS
jgi:triosephosphate isomerase